MRGDEGVRRNVRGCVDRTEVCERGERVGGRSGDHVHDPQNPGSGGDVV